MDKQKIERCPNQVGAFSGIPIDGKKIIAGPLNCNSWTCPVCQKILKKKLYKRILQGAIGEEPTSKHALKFLTITFGGKEARLKAIEQLKEYNKEIKKNAKNIHDYFSRKLTLKEYIYEIMILNFHKLIRALKKKHGKFHYFRICELHKDGIPHFHILLAGNAIIPKAILISIEKLWRGKYGMGFVKINCIKFKNKKHAISYMLKYITKDIQKVGKWKRIFSASQNSLTKIIKKDWLAVKIIMGAVDDTGIKEMALQNDTITKALLCKYKCAILKPLREFVLETMQRMLFQQLKNTPQN